MPINKQPVPNEKLEAWRDEVARANEEFRRRPRTNLRRDARSRGAGIVATKTEVKLPIEEPEST